MMQRSVSAAFVLAWVMWLNAQGQWSAGQAYEGKGECDSQVPVVRDRMVNGYKNLDWRAWAGDTPNSIELRHVSGSQRKNVFLVCYPSEFTPK